MQKKRTLHHSGISLHVFSGLLLFVLLLLTSQGCQSKSRERNYYKQFLSKSDSVFAEIDSIRRVMVNAKTITAEIIECDSGSTSTMQRMEIPRELHALALFLVTSPAMYESDAVTYGECMPQFYLTFFSKGGLVRTGFDFGLGKWRLYDKDGNLIRQNDIYSSDMARFAEMLFPDNTYMKSLNDKNKKP